MQQISFNINIKASAIKIWKTMWADETYKIWTAPFCEGCYYKVDEFKQGSRIHFLSLNGDGMYSNIETLIENKYIAFRHIGELKKFEEQPVTHWTNAIEAYEIIENIDGSATLIAKADMLEQFIDFMNDSFPRAMSILKSICEK